MKKITIAFLGLAATLLMGLFIAVPVIANPADGQKVPVEIKWKPTGSTLLDRLDSDGLSHRWIRTTWNVELYIDGSLTPITGTAVTERLVLWAFSKLQMAIYNEDYVLSFPTLGGGFEGNAHLVLKDYVSATDYQMKVHGLFQGTGDLEGQTINAGLDWGPPNYTWQGYLLKP